MNDASFLKAIFENPADDALRLVYADWLEEHGPESSQARAALIRIQHEAESLSPYSRRRVELDQQARRLIRDNPSWSDPIRKGKFGRSIKFRLGFPHQITTRAINFVSWADRLLAAVPTLRGFHFPHASNEVRDLAGCRYLSRISELDISNMCACGQCPIGAEIRLLLQSPGVAELTNLNISDNRVDPALVRVLTESPHLKRLQWLDLSNNRISNGGVQAILNSPLVDQLRFLNLRNNDISTRNSNSLRERFGNRVRL